MPVVNDQVSVAANASNTDVLDGKRAQNLPNIPGSVFQCVVLSTAAATGVEQEVFVGGSNPVERSGVSTQNRVPISPDDIVGEFQARGGEKITWPAHNTTGLAIIVFFKLVTTQIA